MRPRHVLWPLRRSRDLVDVDRRGVAEQQRTRLHRVVELGEDLLLHRNLLEHRFDHRVAIRDISVALDRLDQRQALVHLRLREAAALHADRIIVPDASEAALQRLGRGVQQLHRQPGIGAAHRNAAAHGAGADHCHGPDLGCWRVLRQMRQARHLALGEKGVAQGAGLIRVLELTEQPLLFGDPLGEGQARRRLYRGDAVVGRLLVAGLARDGLARHLEHAGLGRRRRHLADPPQGLARDIAREGDRRAAQIAVDQRIDDAKRLGLRRWHVPTRADHLERRLRPDQSRQPLRAATAREDADQHLRQPDLRRGHRDPPSAAERVLQPAAQRIAMDRRDHRLAAALQRIVAAPRRRLALGPEAADIGARDEAAPGADQHDGLDRGIGIGAIDPRHDPIRDARAQGIHRRIVDGDDGDAVLDRILHHRALAHAPGSVPLPRRSEPSWRAPRQPA